MAAVRLTKQAPVGSAQWILDEKDFANQFVCQEIDDFAFSAYNELEWLNEHMAEVFNRTEFDVAEVFKTPGKLRGKTPKTVRKRNPLETRVPLTDIFSATPQSRTSPSHATQFYKQVAQFQIAEEDQNYENIGPAISRFSSGLGKENTDSGDHVITEDEVEMEQNVHQPLPRSSTKINLQVHIPQHQSPTVSLARQKTQIKQRESAESFVSAKEIPSSKLESDENSQKDDDPTEEDDDVEQGGLVADTVHGLERGSRDSHRYSVSAETENALDNALEQAESPIRQPMVGEGDQSASEVSSPAKSVLRKKSSLNFASLPAREPLTSKKSMGTRTSRTSHVEQPKSNSSYPTLQENHFDKYAVGKSPTGSLLFGHDAEGVNIGSMKIYEDSQVIEPDPESTKLHSKTSTQRLHERITMLGKSNVPRISKSISAGVVTHLETGLELAPKPPSKDVSQGSPYMHGDRDDWIGPISAANCSRNLHLPQILEQSDLRKEVTNENFPSTVNLAEKYGDIHQVYDSLNGADVPPHCDTAIGQDQPNTVIASYPILSSFIGISKTSEDSPANRRIVEGPLSASKSKLYSVLKSARTIFASSAGVSAQAKLEALSSKPRSPYSESSTATARASQPQQPSSSRKAVPDHDSKRSEDCIGKLKQKEPHDAEERGRAANFEKGPTIDAGKAAVEHDARTYATTETNVVPSQENEAMNMPPPPPPKCAALASQSQASNGIRRPRSQAKDTASKSRPALLSIRVGTPSQKVGQTAQSSVLQDGQPQDPLSLAVSSKQPTLLRQASTSSLHTASSTQSFKTSVSMTLTRPRALEIAARKKEQDEKEVQRKAEQKRDMERRRGVRLEEEKRIAQQHRAAEQQRSLDVKNAAQRLVAEQRNLEIVKRNEQQHAEAAAAQHSRDELANALHYEQSQIAATHQRSDLGAGRPASRMTNTADSVRPAVPHVNPARPAKRVHQPDDKDNNQPVPKAGLSNGQPPAKRRRTSEDFATAPPTRPTMASPMRLSNMRMAQEVPGKFAHGYMNNQHSSHAAPSIFKSTVTAQHNLQHTQHPKTPHMNDLAQFSKARIPFADAPNPPQQQFQSKQPGTSKTPATATQKSSPQYPNGDSIDLPEIATDSEDSEDDKEFEAPDWANSPALRELLRQQQLMDPMKVFGPIAPLMMEEVFKGNKERQARFRARTSSANWGGPDRLTEEERRRDKEARERMENDGGWTFKAAV